MERNHHLTDAGSRVARTIRVRADRLARSGAVPGMDADDIAQDLRLDLVERAPRYDPARASFETFADRVTANRIATLASPTARLRAERGMRDLHGQSGASDDGEGLPLADMLPESAALHAAERAEPDRPRAIVPKGEHLVRQQAAAVTYEQPTRTRRTSRRSSR